MFGQRRGVQGGLSEQPECAFGSDQQSCEFESVVGEDASEMVPAAVAGQGRLPFADQVFVFSEDPFQVIAESLVRVGRIGRADRRVTHQFFTPRFDHRPVADDQFEFFDVVACGSDSNRSGTGGIDGQHAADGGDRAVGGVGREVAPQWAELSVEFVEDDSGLDGHGRRVDCENAVKVTGKVDHNARPQASSSYSASGPPRKHTHFDLGRIPNDRHDIVSVSRSGDGQRRDVEQAGVTGVEGDRERVDEQFTLEHAAKILDHQLPLLVHSPAVPSTGLVTRWPRSGQENGDQEAGSSGSRLRVS